MIRYLNIFLLIIAGMLNTVQAQSLSPLKNAYWWPEQKLPKKIVICKLPANKQEQMLAQSVAGLVARAVNENQSDEIVWVQTSMLTYHKWYDDFVKQHDLKKNKARTVWELADKYRVEGVIKGYILYSRNDSSINVATVYAGLKNGILIEESLEQKAKDKGFKLLIDARGKDIRSCFLEEKDNLNKKILVVADPSLPNNRDLAIAHKGMVYYGVDSCYNSILEWMDPISPIVGWNEGPESAHIEPPTKFGHFNTASDYCMNMTVLSAGSIDIHTPEAKTIDPRTIDFNKDTKFHAFVISDGDNMQWTMNAFFNEDYYCSPQKHKIPISWTSCPVNISMMSPYTWKALVKEQNANSSIIEFSGGYHYPDIFGKHRANRWELLREYARKTNVHMKRTGIKVLNLMIRHDVFSEDAYRAFSIYAEEVEDLTGIIAIQYNPYHGGNGETIWVKNKKGTDIPVVTSKYSLWGKISNPGFGRPDQVAEWINRDASSTGATMHWTMVHAWSRYKMNEDGSIVDVPNSDYTGKRGVVPVKWTVDRIKSHTDIITIEELIWRIRMKYNPEQTKSIIYK